MEQQWNIGNRVPSEYDATGVSTGIAPCGGHVSGAMTHEDPDLFLICP